MAKPWERDWGQSAPAAAPSQAPWERDWSAGAAQAPQRGYWGTRFDELADAGAEVADAAGGAARALVPAARGTLNRIGAAAADLEASGRRALSDSLGGLPGFGDRYDERTRGAEADYGRFQGAARAAEGEVQGIQSEFEDGSLGYHAVGVSRSIPTMGAAIGVSALAGPLAGAATIGGITASEQYAQAREGGAGRGTAALSGAAHGALEGGMDYITLGIAKYGAGPVLERLAKLVGEGPARTIVQRAAQTVPGRVAAAAGAGAAEEVLTTAGQMGSDQLILDQDYSLDDYIKAFRDSAVQGGAMGAGAYGVMAGAESRAAARDAAERQEQRNRFDATFAGETVTPVERDPALVQQPEPGDVAEGIDDIDLTSTRRLLAEIDAQSEANAAEEQAAIEAQARAEREEMARAAEAQRTDNGQRMGQRAALEIEQFPSLTPEQREVESRARQQVVSDPQQAILDYKALPETEGGRVVSTDEAREIFPDYNAGPDARSANAVSVHEPSSWVAKRVLDERLAMEPTSEDAFAYLTGGGTGAGKTSGRKRIEAIDRLYRDADFVYDGNLQSEKKADDLIRRIKKSGRKVQIVYTMRDPVEAWRHGALPRASKESYGRTVPADVHAGTHVNAAKTGLALAKKYAADPDVRVRFIYNSFDGKTSDARLLTDPAEVRAIAEMDPSQLTKELTDVLEQEHAAGRIPERVYRGSQPSAPVAEAAVDGGGRHDVERVGRDAVREEGAREGSDADGRADRADVERGAGGEQVRERVSEPVKSEPAAKQEPRQKAEPKAKPVDRSFVDQHARRFTERTGVGVNVVENYADIPGAPRDDGNTTALYVGGKIYVVRSRQQNATQTLQDIVHEVTHLGIDKLLGKQYAQIMQAVYDFAVASPSSAAGIKLAQISEAYPNASPQELADEVLAHLAENYRTINQQERSLVKRAGEAIRALMRKLGLVRRVDDDYVFQLIRDAHANARRNARGSQLPGIDRERAAPPAAEPVAGNGEPANEASGARARKRRVERSTTGMFDNFGAARKELGLSQTKNNKAYDVGVALNQYTIERFGAIDAADRSDAAVAKLSAAMADEVSMQLRVTSEATGSGVGWYSNNYPNAVRRLARKYPELADDAGARSMFTAMLAITSNGEKVRRNLVMAEQMYARWREGKSITEDLPATRRASALETNAQLLEQLEERFGYDGVADHLLEEMRVSDINKELRARGETPSSQYTADMVLPRAALYFGPKLGAFYANLAGSDGYLTMDLWWSRSFNRYRGNLVPQPTKSGLARLRNLMAMPEDATDEQIIAAAIPHWESYRDKNYRDGTELEKAANTVIKAAMLELNEAPENARDRKFMYAVAKHAQRRLAGAGQSVSIADIQAALWYYEKRLYAGLGVRGRDDVGYEEAINERAAEGDRPVGSFARVRRAGGRGRVSEGEGVGAAGDVRGGEGRARARRRGDGSRGSQAGGDAQGARAPLDGAPRVKGAAGPDPRLVAVAERYAAEHGIQLRRQAEYAKVDPERAARIAAAYDAMEHAPQDPRVAEAYADLIRQTTDQYRALEAAGYRFWLMDPGNDPYGGNPWNAMRDLRATQSMAVFPTDAGFGSGATELDVSSNPLLADTGLRWPFGSPDGQLRPVLANDLFRAVHDAFGHGIEGAGFRADGEENAWQAHARLFTGPALGALTSETRGQNSWLNYGPYGEANRTASVEDTVFADQKTGLMPEWTWTEGRVADEAAPAEESRARRRVRPETAAAYEQRIDELFAGAPANRQGAKVLDSSDVLALLGHGEKPLYLQESKVLAGRFVHGLTAEHWKRIPEWLENPAAVFDSETVPGRLVLVAPEAASNGAPIVMVVEPDTKADRLDAHLLVNAYDRDGRTPFERWARDGLLRYVNTKRNPQPVARSERRLPGGGQQMGVSGRAAGTRSGLQLSGLVHQARGQRQRVLTDRDLVNLRQTQAGADTRRRVRMPASGGFDGYTLPTEDIREAMAQAAGKRMQAYAEALKATGRRFRRTFQDDLLPVKQAEEAIRELGNYDPDVMNVYQVAELFYGRVGNRLEKFRREHINPLIHEIARQKDFTMEELEEFLYAMFAPQRNRAIYEANKTRANAHEYLDGKSGMTNDEARQILQGFQNRGLTSKLMAVANRIYAMNEARIDLQERAGLITPEMATEWRKEQYYVPLRGFADGRELGFQMGPRAGKGFSVSGAESRRAKGRDSRAANLIENVIAQNELAIVRAEKNRVAQSMIALAAANPNEAMWTVERVKFIPARDRNTGEVVEDSTGQAVGKLLRPDGSAAPIFIAKVDGKEYAIRFKGESGERLAAALKNLGSANLGEVLQKIRGVMRWLSMARTTLNPEFVISNFARDIQTAMGNLTVEQSAALARETFKGIKPAMGAIFRWESSESGVAGAKAWDQHYQEFLAAGGRTDFGAARDVDQIVADIRSEMARAGHGWTRKGVRRTWDFFIAMNTAVENSSRLAAFVAARKAGMSPKDAASVAKNLTVNFNRRGSAGPALNSIYMFANASIQGTARFAQFVASNPKKAALYWAMPMFSMGVAASFLNTILGGDDDDGEARWAKVPDHERDRNLVLMYGDHRIKIPLPYVYSLPYTIGVRAADMAQGLTKPATAASAIVSSVVEGVNPVGNPFVPTLAQPFYDVQTNTNFFGSPVRPEQKFEKYPVPDSQKFWESTPRPYVWLAEAMNSITGGNKARSGAIDISPTTIQTMVDFMLGGLGGFGEKMFDTSYAMLSPSQDLKPNRVPFASKVYATTPERQPTTDYYLFRADAAARIEERDIAIENGTMAEATPAERRSYGVSSALGGAMRSTERELSSLRKARKAALDRDDAEAAQRYSEKMRDSQDRFNRVYVELMRKIGEPTR